MASLKALCKRVMTMESSSLSFLAALCLNMANRTHTSFLILGICFRTYTAKAFRVFLNGQDIQYSDATIRVILGCMLQSVSMLRSKSHHTFLNCARLMRKSPFFRPVIRKAQLRMRVILPQKQQLTS